MAQRPSLDLFTAPDTQDRDASDLAYGAAHHAFAFLVRRYGEQAVLAILKEMAEGPVFADAFEAALGLSEEDFLDDFRRYVRMGGYRSGRLAN
jgi:hypothetical protein